MATSIFAGPPRKKPLVEFKAGKMTVRGKLVSPDTRKGLITLEIEDNLLHFKWKDRTSGTVEIDKIVFPEAAVFKRVTQCTTGRVYLLEYPQNQSRLFFWMQDPSEDKDAEVCKKVNDLINNPPQASQESGLDQNALLSMMQGMSRGGGATRGRAERASAAATGGAAASTSGSAAASTSGSAAASGASASSASPSASASASASASSSAARDTRASISPDFLQGIISGLSGTGGQGGQQLSQRAQQQLLRQRNEPSLQTVLEPENITALVEDPEAQRQLLQHLPEGRQTVEELREVIHSPQFQQAVGMLNAAIQSGEIEELLPHFGLSSSTTGDDGGLTALAKALAQQAQQRTNSNNNSSNTQESKDMDVDKARDEHKDDKSQG